MHKLALVTGGAHPMGIGYGAARALNRIGFDVIVTGISEQEVAQTPASDWCKAVVLDVTSDAACAVYMASLDRLDALVNCAGTASYGEFELAAFERTVAVNLTGTMRMCTLAHDLLAASGGAIVNVGSMYSVFGSADAPAYAASKGAVVQLTKSLAVAWAKHGIRVNAVLPGWIKTNMSRVLWENEAIAAPITARTPMGRWGEAQELGDAIGFLCAPDSRYITGVALPVDGGYLASG